MHKTNDLFYFIFDEFKMEVSFFRRLWKTKICNRKPSMTDYFIMSETHYALLERVRLCYQYIQARTIPTIDQDGLINVA